MQHYRIAILGAIDRFNYGDLLFPHIIESALAEQGLDVSFRYFGLVKSDFLHKGGKPTESLNTFYKCCKLREIDVVIVAGGESFGTSWSRLYGFTNRVFLRLSQSRLARFVSFERLARKIVHAQSDFPFIFTRSELGIHQPILLNSLGGHHFKKESSPAIDLMIQRLNNIEYVSVRDRDTFTGLQHKGVLHAHLYPDSAILMSEFFSKEKLRHLINQKTTHQKQLQGKPYVFFQLSKYKSGKDLSQVVAQLKIIIDAGYSICLCPIGTAPGHEDHIPLRSINEQLGEASVFIQNPSLWDIMYLISEAKLYIGTSLHGVITAMSFCVPYLAVNKQVKKVQSYLDTWSCEELNKMIDVSEIAQCALKAMQLPVSALETSRSKQIELSRESFKNMKGYFKNNI